MFKQLKSIFCRQLSVLESAVWLFYRWWYLGFPNTFSSLIIDTSKLNIKCCLDLMMNLIVPNLIKVVTCFCVKKRDQSSDYEKGIEKQKL